MTQIPVALQLYAVRNECATNLDDTLRRVGAMGYDGVEFAGFHNHDAAEVRRMLDNAGLKVAGAHVPLEQLLPDKFDDTVAFHQEIGNRFLIVPGVGGEHGGSRESWLKTAALFNDIAARLRPHGMSTGYHNHTVEFVPFDGGETPWDLFFGNTDADVVMQIDTGNALDGGAIASVYLEKYPGRARTVHLKEYPDGLIGEGKVAWNDVFRLVEAQGKTEWYIVEQEGDKYPPLEYVELWLKKLKSWRG
jgi:sugar phosphate isomerase/epimerase